MSENLNIGKIIDTPQERDAIHIAVAPVVAGEQLRPGVHAGMRSGLAYECLPSGIADIGIVDPFLRHPVEKGQTFWLFLHPGSITSLRHDWTHPAFGPAALTEYLEKKRGANG